MGCVARNFFGKPVEAFPGYWGQWIVNCILALLLTRGGLSVTFKGKGLIVLVFMTIPQICEASIIALVAYGFYEMPIEVAYCLAFFMSTVASAIIVPGMLALNDKGYGKSKGIPGTMIAASTFENILAIVCFGICRAITFNNASLEITGET